MLSKAHLADIGNAEPTTYSAMARDVYEEGAVILPCVKVQGAYEDIADVIRMCQVRIRVPDKRLVGATTWRCLARLGSGSAR